MRKANDKKGSARARPEKCTHIKKMNAEAEYKNGVDVD